MKKFLIFINSLGGGGAEKVLLNFLKMVDYSSYDITVISVIGGIYEAQIPEQVEYKKIIKTSNKILIRLFSSVLNHIPHKLFNKLFLNKKVDLKIAYLEGFPSKVLWFDKTCKTVAFVHCDVSVKNVLKPYYKSVALCLKEYRNFDKVCFVSKAAKEGFFSTIGKLDNAEVLYNVVDWGDIIDKGEQYVSSEYQTKGLKLITVGRLSVEKGYARLLEVVSELEKNYQFELWILGEGSERSTLEKIIEQRKIRSVKLLGFVSNPYPYIKKADLFICSSLFEGYSTVVNESLVLRVPVITTDCAGMNELLDNGKYGIIVENNKLSLLQGLTNIFENPKIIEEFKTVLSQKERETNIEGYENLFSKLLNS